MGRLVRAAQRACGTPALAGLLSLQILIALSEGVGLALVVPVIQSVQEGGAVTLPVLKITVGPLALLTAIVVAVIVRAGMQWAATVHGDSVEFRTTDELRLSALDALLNARWSYLSTQRRSHVVQKLTTDIMRASGALDQLIMLTVSLLILAATTAVAIYLNPAIGGLALLAVLAVGLASIRDVKRAGTLGEAWSDRIEAFGAVVTDSLASARMVRAHDASDIWMRSLRKEAAHGRTVQVRYVRTSAGTRAALSVAAVVGVVALVLICLWIGVESAVLIALVLVVSRMLGAAQSIVWQAQSVANDAPALDSVQAITRAAQTERDDHVSEVADASDRRPTASKGEVSPLVRVRDLTVTYPNSPQSALLDVNLSIHRGESVAVIGPSGAGKSTLLDVVLGLTVPNSGSVEIDGQPLGNSMAWRARTAYVPQEVLLIPGTVRQNVVWTMPPGVSITDEQVWDALDDAAAGDVVRSLPNGLDTELGETAELSGGEKQRLSIARALLRSPELLVLDEAASAIDVQTEERVLHRILARSGAVLLVTHRLDAANRADRVVALEEGRTSPVNGSA